MCIHMISTVGQWIYVCKQTGTHGLVHKYARCSLDRQFHGHVQIQAGMHRLLLYTPGHVVRNKNTRHGEINPRASHLGMSGDALTRFIHGHVHHRAEMPKPTRLKCMLYRRLYLDIRNTQKGP